VTALRSKYIYFSTTFDAINNADSTEIVPPAPSPMTSASLIDKGPPVTHHRITTIDFRSPRNLSQYS
jgi:hypothetical protein